MTRKQKTVDMLVFIAALAVTCGGVFGVLVLFQSAIGQ